MHWFLYILLALPVAALGLLCGGYIGDHCVRWYRISSFEGGSGYFVVGLALLGGVVGLVTALVTAGALAPQQGPGYLKAFGTSTGIVLAMACLALLSCWLLADIPPRLHGRELTIEVEVRLPADAPSPRDAQGESRIELHSVAGRTSRASQRGTLRPNEARLENGRWIVPGDVFLFTMRGHRSLSFRLDGGEITGFLAPIPARPGPDFLAWSDWYPRPPAPNPPWPDSRLSYRFRLRTIEPPPPPPSAEESRAREEAEAQARFDAIPADAPFDVWLAYSRHNATDLRATIATERLLARPDLASELARRMQLSDIEPATDALRFVRRIPHPSPDLVDPLRAVARTLGERLREFNVTPVEVDPSYEKAADISRLFSAWFPAVSHLRERLGTDFTSELATILTLARQRPDSQALRADVVRVASHYLHEWAGVAPLPTDPKPR
ncbi:MAG: hypothetical protein KF833_10545 [Verrucomicrobiae bacterium]|nr:hypothetical protein [Verrucomicrobiae bacterium]